MGDQDQNNNLPGGLLGRLVHGPLFPVGGVDPDWNHPDEDWEAPDHVVWRRTGPVERLPSGMWRRLKGRLKKIVYPSS